MKELIGEYMLGLRDDFARPRSAAAGRRERKRASAISWPASPAGPHPGYLLRPGDAAHAPPQRRAGAIFAFFIGPFTNSYFLGNMLNAQFPSSSRGWASPLPSRPPCSTSGERGRATREGSRPLPSASPFRSPTGPGRAHRVRRDAPLRGHRGALRAFSA